VRLYIISLGFDITQVTYMLSKVSLFANDKLLFIVPEVEVPRSKQSRAAIEEVIDGLIARGQSISYEYCKVSETDVINDLKILLEYTSRGDYDEIHVWAIGGPRSIVTLLTLYGQIDPRVKSVYTYSESKMHEVKVPKFIFSYPKLNKYEMMILEILAKHNTLSITELSNKISCSQSSIYRVINKLSRNGLITRLRGRRGKIEITDSGKLLLSIYKLYQLRK